MLKLLLNNYLSMIIDNGKDHQAIFINPANEAKTVEPI
jgi:hypothetical protein